MGRQVLILGMAAAVLSVLGLSIQAERHSQAQEVSFQEALVGPEDGPVVEVIRADAGSALATAAFGLSALQPETFNSEVVFDIIEASPLEKAEKQRLAEMLISAQGDRGELPEVLEDIRISLAVD